MKSTSNDPIHLSPAALSRPGVLRALVLDMTSFAYLFLVFALVVFQPSEEFRQQVSNLLAGFLGSMGFGFVAALLVRQFRFVSLGRLLFSPHSLSEKDSVGFSFWNLQLAILLLTTLSVGFQVTRFSWTDLLDQDGFAGAVRLFQGLTQPNWAILADSIWAIIETVYIAFIATFLAIPIAFVLSFVCAKNLMGGSWSGNLVYTSLRGFFNVVRSIEALIWAIIASVWVGIGPFAGMLALMVHSIASLTKQYSEIVESIHEGPVEGVESTGASRLQVIWFAVVPQVVLPYISFTIYRWDINVRMATIIGLVGGGGIGTMLIQYQGQAMWNEVGTIIVVIAAVVWLMDSFSAQIRSAIK